FEIMFFKKTVMFIKPSFLILKRNSMFRTNSISKSDFDFEISGNEKRVTYIHSISIFSDENKVEISLHTFDDYKRNLPTYEFCNITIENADKYLALIKVMTGQISPVEAATELGIKYQIKGLFIEYRDSSDNMLNKESPLWQLNKLLVNFPR